MVLFFSNLSFFALSLSLSLSLCINNYFIWILFSWWNISDIYDDTERTLLCTIWLSCGLCHRNAIVSMPPQYGIRYFYIGNIKKTWNYLKRYKLLNDNGVSVTEWLGSLTLNPFHLHLTAVCSNSASDFGLFHMKKVFI